MTPVETDGANEPFDELDASILAEVRQLWAERDPLPDGLVDQIQFAIDLEHLDVEVLRMTLLDEATSTRGDEVSRLVTFSSDTLTIMIRVFPAKDGTNRIDGWLTPGDSHPVELRTGDDTLTTESDTTGRFAFRAVPGGLAQLMVKPAGTAKTVTTPAILL
ncbi:MAG TPA: hypothetical protein VHF06_30515 [Pseudonocardiaceae bacterium]|jgi:hypothetical protein|nr:hypothetical protein [Pseudonocardiaceae bacterium]